MAATATHIKFIISLDSTTTRLIPQHFRFVALYSQQIESRTCVNSEKKLMKNVNQISFSLARSTRFL
jgi:hypothetical protein